MATGRDGDQTQGGRGSPGGKGDKKKKKKGGGGGGGSSSGGSWQVGWNFGNPLKQARRDVRMFIRPQIRAIRNARGQAKDDYQEYADKLGSLYDILGANLSGITGTMGDLYADTNANYTSGTEDILGALGASTAPDQAGFLNSLGTQALAGSRQLGTMGQTALNQGQSYQTQGELERLVTGRNALGELNDQLDLLRQQKLDVLKDRPTMMKQRLDELRQLAWERWMAEREYKLRAAQVAQGNQGQKGLMAYLNSLTNDTGAPWGGGGPKGGPKGGGPKGGGPKASDKDLFRSLLQGRQKYGMLGAGEQNRVEDFLANRAGAGTKVMNQYENFFGDPYGMGPYTTENYLEALRKLARGRYADRGQRT